MVLPRVQSLGYAFQFANLCCTAPSLQRIQYYLGRAH